MEHAHLQVGGEGPGRRYATQQLNHAYAMLLSSHFQGFCRGLHSEAVDFLVDQVTPVAGSVLPVIVRQNLVWARKLDRGNPNPGHLGSDFGRLGISFWAQVEGLAARNTVRKGLLEDLCQWRNAIAHQDFSGRGPRLQLQRVKRWRRACDGLAKAFDKVVGNELRRIVGSRPW